MPKVVKPSSETKWLSWRQLIGAAAVLVILGCGYLLGRNVWAYYQFRAAQQALSQFRLEDARRHLASALQVWQDDMETTFLAARTARRAKAYDEAERLLMRYQRIGGVPEAVQFERVLQRVQRGDLSGLEVSLWAAVDRSPEDAPFILEALYRGYLATIRWPEALRTLDAYLSHQPRDPAAAIERGWLREKLGDQAGALEDFRTAVASAPTDFVARLSLAEALAQASRPQDALPEYREALQLRPEDPSALLGTARCHRQLDQISEAERLVQQVLASDPANPRALSEKARLAVLSERLEAAERAFREALAVSPHDRETHYDFIQCLRRLEKPTEAEAWQAKLNLLEKDLDRLQELFATLVDSPGNPDLTCEMAEIMARRGRQEQALAWVREVLTKHPDHERAKDLLVRLNPKRS